MSLNTFEREYALRRVSEDAEISGSQIARELDTFPLYVNEFLKSVGLPRKRTTPFKKAKPIELNDFANSIITGSLLGDGSITKHGDQKGGYLNSKLRIKHGIIQKEYGRYKKQLLLNQNIKVYEYITVQKDIRVVAGESTSYLLCTQGNPAFNYLRNLWYPEGIKIVPQSIELDPIALAIWYQDDGCFTSKSNMFLATNAFNEQDKSFLTTCLKKTYGIETAIHRPGVIYIPVKYRACFWSIIEPYVHESMRYKCPV